jgi:hypothetical protein
VTAQLHSIQSILQELGIDAYLRSASSDRALSTLGIEIQTGERESNLLEICEISIPDSELFLLQWFVQLPMGEPFSPADAIPDFQIPEVLLFCAELNQILPVGIFNIFENRLCFRHIFTCEFVSATQVEYLLQTIEGSIQRIQPLLQEVAIGTITSEQAIDTIDSLFTNPEEDAQPTLETLTSSSERHSERHSERQRTEVKKMDDTIGNTEQVNSEATKSIFSIDDLAELKIQITDSSSDDGWNDGWEDDWDLSDDVVIFEEDSSD